MSAFIELHEEEVPIFLNVDHIIKVDTRRYDARSFCVIFASEDAETWVEETYEQVANKIREALARIKERKGKSPLTIPLKEREETNNNNCARACEKNLTCDGFRVPSLDEAKAYAETGTAILSGTGRSTTSRKTKISPTRA